MNDLFRPASITADDLETIEAGGQVLLATEHRTAGLRLLAIALRLREQTQFRAADQVFMCDVDESAGMAEVFELQGYSRKVRGDARRAPCQ